MERRLFVLKTCAVAIMVSFITAPVFAQNNDGGPPSSKEMIRQRLQSDLEELREENKKLKKKIQRLENNGSSRSQHGSSGQVEALKAENERLRNVLSQYRQIFKDLVKRIQEADSIYQQQVGDHPEVTGETIRESAESKGEKWIKEPDRPYPIRREPLQEEITYTTDPDDTLSKLAHQFYHDAELWIRIYLVNEDRLKSPDSLPPGTKLRLPPIDRIKQ